MADIKIGNKTVSHQVRTEILQQTAEGSLIFTHLEKLETAIYNRDRLVAIEHVTGMQLAAWMIGLIGDYPKGITKTARLLSLLDKAAWIECEDLIHLIKTELEEWGITFD
jgi:hypothetical protein